MAQTPGMRERVAYLRDQALAFRRMAEAPGNRPFHDLLTELAQQCDEIAGTIERNLSAGIFDRASGTKVAESPAPGARRGRA